MTTAVIYLAGPEVFLADAVELGMAKKALCQRYGFIGLFPLDAEVQSPDPDELPWAISRGNEALIRQADILIANLTPFRGPSADVGTVYELGLARGLGKRLSGYSNDPASFLARSWSQFGPAGQPVPGPEGDIRDRDGLKIEEFGLHDNLMIEGGIRQSAGTFISHAASEATRYTDLTAFERLLQQLA
ncbi:MULTISPECIES: nucleoside 2-deoxyribosyltransferase [unclassified Oceanobacter]|uniref:nucleoside 2-deoxyribosyltransferase n=1 Tax=unclassified Oceanobacter TaxID=2620260 RepID=UPI0027350A97|nr:MULTISPECIES: nucleoside 2-deoxyribosyltransferase [unclassified Oceanobacter]MDP2506062.1 nucleoside 2-deoxyribosyltransferase [Oceanobacter sp. 3_MG-2023]MDP2547641.1 nucleoside 2-deoxyribosyltransferase [Oceanobacter sp. 4_MG-2023]